jgi:hypothetical protein
MTYSSSPTSGRHHAASTAAEWPSNGDRGAFRTPGGYPPGPAGPPQPPQPTGSSGPSASDSGAWSPFGARPEPQWTPPRSAFDGPAPQSSSSWAQPEEPSPQDLFWADLRRQVGYTLRSINAKHCHDAYDRLNRRDALSPQGVVLFYTAAAPEQPQGYKLHFVVRLNFTGPEFDDLAVLLDGLTRTAVKNITNARATGRRWDPRGPEGSIVNAGNLDMPRNATYVGAGVSSLDTEQGDWFTVSHAVRSQPMSRSSFDIPGQGLALLTDGTALRMVRDPNRRLGDDGITCNKTLDAHRLRHWNRFADLTEQGDPHTREAWGHLGVLHGTLQEYLVVGQPR